jgi:hypothetical protein
MLVLRRDERNVPLENNERAASSTKALEMEVRDPVWIESLEVCRDKLTWSGRARLLGLSGAIIRLSLEYSVLRTEPGAIIAGEEDGNSLCSM